MSEIKLAEVEEQRDQLLAALKAGYQKLLTYGHVYPGDKELHQTLIPMWKAAIAKAEAVKPGTSIEANGWVIFKSPKSGKL